MNVSTYVLPVLLIALIIVCIVKKVKVYDCFLLGAKDGLNLVIDVFPYIASIFVCIELFTRVRSGIFLSMTRSV